MNDYVIDRAIKLRDRLISCAGEFAILKATRLSKVEKELAAEDELICREAAATLQKLGTEVTRLRLAIRQFYSGRMTEKELHDTTDNWNGDKGTHK